MYKYIKTKKFSGLIRNGQYLKVPKTIDDLYSFKEMPDISKWKIGDTPSDKKSILTWHELKDDTKTILICDRVLVNNISANDLNEYINGIRITIDSEDYICRLILSGTEYNDRYHGTKDKKEWDYIIGGNQQIIGLPPIFGENIKYNYDKKDINSTHNQFWNWANIGTITSNFKDNNVFIRGNYSPDFIYEKELSSRGNDFGWRPILEKVVNQPIIEGESGRLGEFLEPFKYKYMLKSYERGESALNTTIKLDGNVIEQEYIESNTDKELDLGEYWNGLYKGRHTIEIETVNEKGLSASKFATFNTPTPTLVDKEGLDYFAKQLWNTKIKTFVADFSKRQGGLVLDANEKFLGDGQIETNQFADCGKCISTTVDTDIKTLAKFTTDAVKLGQYGVVLRGSTTNKVDTETFEIIISVNIENEKIELARQKFKSSDFREINKFSTLYMTFDYNTKKVNNQTLEIEIKTLVNSTNHTIKLDYLLIAPMLPTVFAF